jgi:hypothetical protein
MTSCTGRTDGLMTLVTDYTGLRCRTLVETMRNLKKISLKRLDYAAIRFKKTMMLMTVISIRLKRHNSKLHKHNSISHNLLGGIWNSSRYALCLPIGSNTQYVSLDYVSRRANRGRYYVSTLRKRAEIPLLNIFAMRHKCIALDRPSICT